MKEARKLELQAAKEAKQDMRAEQRKVLREERMTHDTRRARMDCRRLQAAVKRKERTGQEARCEHGFAHCKLCHMRG